MTVIQTINVLPVGSVETLETRGKGIDLKPMGNASVNRAADIVFLELYQKWAIKFLIGEFAGQYANNAYRGMQTPYSNEETINPPLLFSSYNDAVKEEALIVNNLLFYDRL